MATFNDMEDLKDFDTYKKRLNTAIGKAGSSAVKFQCRKEFTLKNGTKKNVVLLDASPNLLKDVAKNGKMEAEGTCKENDDKKPAFTVTRGKAGTLKVALKEAAQNDAVVGVDMDEVTANMSKDDVESEIAQTKETGAVATSKVSPGEGEKSIKEKLSEHLKDTGRSKGEPSKTIKTKEELQQHIKDSGGPDLSKREEMAGKILKGMEKNIKERRGDVDNPMHDVANPHAVSGHGPGTDQVPRLVSGRRSDEIEEENTKGLTPTDKTSLTGNKYGLKDQEVAKYTTVGSDGSSTSSSFSSSIAMLHAIEDALAQANQVEAFYNKHPDKKPPRVQEVEKKLEEAREELKKLKTKPRTTPAEIQKVDEEADELKKKVAQFNKDLLMAMRQAPDVSSSYVGKKTGSTTPGKEFLPGGMGEGIEIDNPSKVAKLGDSGEPLDEETMKKRFQSIKPSGQKETAKVVLDPSFVKDEKTGEMRRSGFDVQTAFPSDKGMQKPISKPEDVEAQSQEQEEVETLGKELKELTKKYDEAVKETKGIQKKIDDFAKFKEKLEEGLKKNRVREKELEGQINTAVEPSKTELTKQLETLRTKTINPTQARIDNAAQLPGERLLKQQLEATAKDAMDKKQEAYDKAVKKLQSVTM
jgi:peptidoglycan hydrolase CwlO-like protein